MHSHGWRPGPALRTPRTLSARAARARHTGTTMLKPVERDPPGQGGKTREAQAEWKWLTTR